MHKVGGRAPTIFDRTPPVASKAFRQRFISAASRFLSSSSSLCLHLKPPFFFREPWPSDATVMMARLLYWLRRLYSLDTLDSRFTASAYSTPVRTASDTRPVFEKNARASATARDASPSKWRSPEFYVYYFVFITVVPMMFKTAIDVSQEDHPTYPTYSKLLSSGWIFGRKVDNSDEQYASFRDNIPYLLMLLVIHPLFRRIYELFVVPPDVKFSGEGDILAPAVAGHARLRRRARFDLYFALVFIVALHGASAMKVLSVLYINYRIAKTIPRSYIPMVTWVFNIGTLFANELCEGYPFERMAALLATTPRSSGQETCFVLWGRWLDGIGGLIPRWEILFNITVLRLISFNMDYYWSLDYPTAISVGKKQRNPAALSDRDRVKVPAEASAYNGRNYVAYVLYAPLYLTGPILTFNEYISQQRYPPKSVTLTRTLLYGIRFFLTLLCMEFILHYIYAVAISKSSPNWSMYTPGQLSMLAYFNLHIIWLKLLIPWRFFRFWALIDGIDPPENMIRCMSDNFSAFGFWRSWHRSFNRWIVRYLYIPLGGGESRAGSNKLNSYPAVSNFFSKTCRIFNFCAVFTFVALWHDINLRLLMWGWLITLFVLPEVIAALLFPAHRWRSRPTMYRVLCGIGAVGNILMMMMANLVGFALGLDGLNGLIKGITGSYSGVAYMIGACAALFVGVQVMFEVREDELRIGVNLKC